MAGLVDDLAIARAHAPSGSLHGAAVLVVTALRFGPERSVVVDAMAKGTSDNAGRARQPSLLTLAAMRPIAADWDVPAIEVELLPSYDVAWQVLVGSGGSWHRCRGRSLSPASVRRPATRFGSVASATAGP
jgi:hypothetical protein